MKRYVLLLVVCMASAWSRAQAEVRLPKLFTDDCCPRNAPGMPPECPGMECPGRWGWR